MNVATGNPDRVHLLQRVGYEVRQLVFCLQHSYRKEKNHFSGLLHVSHRGRTFTLTEPWAPDVVLELHLECAGNVDPSTHFFKFFFCCSPTVSGEQILIAATQMLSGNLVTGRGAAKSGSRGDNYLSNIITVRSAILLFRCMYFWR